MLTSRKFMEKVKLEVHAELVYLEDFRSKARLRDKLACSVAAYGVPAGWLERSLGLAPGGRRRSGDGDVHLRLDGQPKGVMLTQANIGSNIEAIEQVVQLSRDDVLVGMLPFFHSFGYTVDAVGRHGHGRQGRVSLQPAGRQAGRQAVKKHGGTVLLATPTFLRTYLRRCDRTSLPRWTSSSPARRNCRKDLCDAFEQKFGIRPVEGYGTTELSPLVSVNIPPSRSPAGDGRGSEGRHGRAAGCRASAPKSPIWTPGRNWAPAGRACCGQRPERHEGLPGPRRI